MTIRQRPLTWFFTLAFLLSWVAWTPYILSENGVGIWHYEFPAVAGTTQLLGVLPGAYLGPIASALLVTSLTEGRAGLRAWVRRMAKWNVNWRWYVIVIVSVPTALVLASTVLGGRAPAMPSAMVLTAYLPMLVFQLITTGLAEEPGWREFAMPRLQHRHGPLRATLIVGPLWGLWHMPLYLTDWPGDDVTWNIPLEFIATTIAFSFVMTWVFNRTGESLPMVMLLHCGVNNYYSVGWGEMFPWLSNSYTTHAFLTISTVAAIILLIATRGRLGLPPAEHPTVPPQPSGQPPVAAHTAPTPGDAPQQAPTPGRRS